MSGIKGRSGRKPDPVVQHLRAQLDEIITASDWRAIWRAAAVAAKKGSIPAIKLIVEYRYGAPSAQLGPAPESAMVAYYMPVRPDQPPPAALVPDPHAPGLAGKMDTPN